MCGESWWCRNAFCRFMSPSCRVFTLKPLPTVCAELCHAQLGIRRYAARRAPPIWSPIVTKVAPSWNQLGTLSHPISNVWTPWTLLRSLRLTVPGLRIIFSIVPASRNNEELCNWRFSISDLTNIVTYIDTRSVQRMQVL